MALPPAVVRLLTSLLAVLLLLVGGGAGVGCALSASVHRGPPGPHFDGTRFVTPGNEDVELRGFRMLLKWQGERKPGPWRPYHDEPAGPRPPPELGPGQMRVTFINHATTLVQLDEVNVLTDPIYSERCSPFSFVGPARVRPPGIRFEDLPRIDAVVVSHNHYDHLDLPTLRHIAARWPGVQFFVGLGNKVLLERAGLDRVTELDWWEERRVRGVTVRSVPSQHASGRGLFDANRTLWTAWVLEGPAGRAYFAGDTGYGPHFAEAARRLGPMRVAVLPIGAFRPEWFMGPVHMSPREAVQAARDLQASLAIPIHFGTFPLADDGEAEPVQALLAARADAGVPFEVLGFGEGRNAP
jgi:L-ascorbate metabolism protein UlaG (beta-lactamase superfamily)